MSNYDKDNTIDLLVEAGKIIRQMHHTGQVLFARVQTMNLLNGVKETSYDIFSWAEPIQMQDRLANHAQQLRKEEEEAAQHRIDRMVARTAGNAAEGDMERDFRRYAEWASQTGISPEMKGVPDELWEKRRGLLARRNADGQESDIKAHGEQTEKPYFTGNIQDDLILAEVDARRKAAKPGESVKVTTHEMELLRRRAEQRGDRVSVHLVPLTFGHIKGKGGKKKPLAFKAEAEIRRALGKKTKKAPRRMPLRRTARKNKKG